MSGCLRKCTYAHDKDRARIEWIKTFSIGILNLYVYKYTDTLSTTVKCEKNCDTKLFELNIKFLIMKLWIRDFRRGHSQRTSGARVGEGGGCRNPDKLGHRDGEGLTQQPRRPSLKKTRTKNIFVFEEQKDINSKIK